MLNAFNTSWEVRESGFDTAVLPLGSLEPKGPHLPVGLDMMLAERFAHDFCRGKNVYVMPTFPFSMAVETRGFKASVSVQQETIWNVIEDVARFIARHGFKRLIVMDLANHNWIVKHCCREINMDLGLIQAVWVNPRQFARESAEKDLLPDFGGGAVETSLAMALFPTLVKGPREDNLPGVPREYLDYEGLVEGGAQGLLGQAFEGDGRPRAQVLRRDASPDGRVSRLRAPAVPRRQAALPPPRTASSGGRRARSPAWTGGSTGAARLGEIASGAADIAIVATSATEQHSPSMALATDYLQALELARGVAKEIGAYLLPSLPYVTSWGHARFPRDGDAARDDGPARSSWTRRKACMRADGARSPSSTSTAATGSSSPR